MKRSDLLIPAGSYIVGLLMSVTLGAILVPIAFAAGDHTVGSLFCVLTALIAGMAIVGLNNLFNGAN